ncbi:MAG: glycosyltransferase [Pseudomonadota bacterium]
MRILFLNNYYYLRGGSERVLFQEMAALEAVGHQVAVFSRRHPENLPTPHESLFTPPMDTQRVSFGPRALVTLRELFYSQANYQAVRRIVAEFKPDVAHAHNIYGRLSTSVLDALRDCQVPAVLTLHDYKLICPNYLLLCGGRICEACKGGRFYQAFLNRCHKGSYAASAVYALESGFTRLWGKYDSLRGLIAPSRFLGCKFAEFGFDSRRIHYIPNCIDTDEYVAAAGMGRHILFLGRLSREKGVDVLLAAHGALPNKPRPPLLIVGDGPERQKLREAAASLEDREFAGYLQGSALRETIRQALAVVVPSVWYENAPLAVLEAMACGKPVIGARIGGISEMIDDAETGYLFEPGNAADLVDKLSRLLGLPRAQLAAMGAAARRKAEVHYSPEAHLSGLLGLYERVLGGERT